MRTKLSILHLNIAEVDAGGTGPKVGLLTREVKGGVLFVEARLVDVEMGIWDNRNRCRSIGLLSHSGPSFCGGGGIFCAKLVN